MSVPQEVLEAIDRLSKYNLGTYNANTNQYGLSGVGGMDANWEQHSSDLAVVGDWLASASTVIETSEATVLAAEAAVLAARALAETAATTATQAAATLTAYTSDPTDKAPVPPIVDLLLTGPGAIQPSWFSRNSIATYNGPDGRLRVAAANEPRFDHDPVTGAARGLLVEESRANLLVWSEDFGNAAWTKSGATVTANTATAPDGSGTADKLVEDTSNSTHFLASPAYSFVAGSAYTYAVNVKAAGRTNVLLGFGNAAFADNLRGRFDLTAGTASFDAGLSGDIKKLDGGWFRIWITATADASASASAVVFAASGVSSTYVGDGTSGLLLWGAQLEQGASATSYIPTTSAPVTRAADTCTIPLSAVVGWSPAEWTLYFEFELTGPNPPAGVVIGGIGDGVLFGNSVYLSRGTNGGLTWSPDTAPVNLSIYMGVVAAGVHRSAIGFSAAGAAASRTGGAVVTDASSAPPAAATLLRLGSAPWAIGNHFNGYIKRAVLWPRRISDALLPTLTA